MEEFTKKINLVVDSSELDRSRSQLDKKFSRLSISGLFKDDEQTSAKIKETLRLKDEIAEVQGAISELESLKLTDKKEYTELLNKELELKKALGEKDRKENDTIKGRLKEFSKQKITQALETIGSKLKDLWGQLMSMMVNMIKGAMEEINNSLSFNSQGSGYSEEAFNQQNTYGFNDAQNYALSRALKKLGMSKEEFELGGYNQARKNRFDEFFKLYEQQYLEMKESGYLENLQKLKDTFELYREQFQNTIMKFIVENGDVIISALQAGLEVLKFIGQILADILGFFSLSSGTSAYQSSQNIDNIINQGVTKNSNANNFNIKNTLISQNDRTTNIQNVQKATRLNYQQIANNLSIK